MTKDKIIEKLRKYNLKLDENMSEHTTFKIGGKSDYFVSPDSIRQISEVVSIANEFSLPFFVLGAGSNLIVSDEGYRGLVISLSEKFNKIEIRDAKIIAQAGAGNSAISKFALENNLTGFEFASGIPGSIGGLVAMNGGAYGANANDIISSVTLMDKKGEIFEKTGEEMEFSHRNSIALREKLIVLEAEISLKKGDYDEIKSLIDDYTNRRTGKQPLEFPSAGSVFKRPENGYASALIDEAGLKGRRVGGAMVSEKHAGFIINYDNATAKDVMGLIEIVKKDILEKNNIHLEMEIQKIGEF